MNDVSLKMRRRRVKQSIPLRERLLKRAELAREQASHLPPGIERQVLMRKAQQAEVVADLEASLTKTEHPLLRQSQTARSAAQHAGLSKA